MHTFVILAYKESPFLEQCIKSVVNQTIKTNVIIATTTPNSFINNLAFKYNLNVVVGEHVNIGSDFDFAINSANTKLVTVAHQDDIYDETYAETVINYYRKYNDSTIIFTDYYEIRNEKKVYSNVNLLIKRFLLLSIRIKKLSGIRHLKRNVIRYGSSICCPAVTFVKKNCPVDIFKCNLVCDVDWYAWEKLSNIKGKFIYINKKIMGHRIDESTTTTDLINMGIRTKEDLYMYKKFWPGFLANIINKIYKKSEKSNVIKNKLNTK